MEIKPLNETENGETAVAASPPAAAPLSTSSLRIFLQQTRKTASTTLGRGFSTGLYFVTARLYGQTPDRLIVLAYFNNMQALNSISREFLRGSLDYLTDAGSFPRAFYRTRMTAYCLGGIATVTNIVYAWGWMPLTNADRSAYHELFWPVCGMTVFNFLVMDFSTLNIASVVLDDFNTMLCMNVGGGIVNVAMYLGFVNNTNIDAFWALLLSTTTQLIFAVGGYTLLSASFFSDMHLYKYFFSLKEFSLTDSLDILKKGFRFGLISAGQGISTVLIVLSLKDKPLELSAYQALQPILNFFTSINSTNEIQWSKFFKDYFSKFSTLPDPTKNIHQANQANFLSAQIIPLILLTIGLAKPEWIINLFLNTTEETEAIRKIAENCVIPLLLLPVAHTAAQSQRAITLANPTLEKENHQITFASFITPLAGWLLGLTADKCFASGAAGYYGTQALCWTINAGFANRLGYQSLQKKATLSAADYMQPASFWSAICPTPLKNLCTTLSTIFNR